MRFEGAKHTTTTTATSNWKRHKVNGNGLPFLKMIFALGGPVRNHPQNRRPMLQVNTKRLLWDILSHFSGAAVGGSHLPPSEMCAKWVCQQLSGEEANLTHGCLHGSWWRWRRYRPMRINSIIIRRICCQFFLSGQWMWVESQFTENILDAGR